MAVTLSTAAELTTAAEAGIEAADSRLTDFREGSNLWALVRMMVVMGDDSLRAVLHRFNDTFIATAEGDALDALIVGFGGPTRIPITAAQVGLTLTRGAFVGAHTITAGTEVTGVAPDGSTVTFTVDANIVLGAMAGSATGTATATEAGRSGNVPAGTLDDGTSLPAGLTLTQPQRAAGGTDEELDDAYRARFQLGRIAHPGTVYGLRYAALSVPGVQYASVSEAFINAEPIGYVALYIGDPDAGSNDELAADVRAVLDGDEDTEGWRVAGINVEVFGAEREEIVFAFTVKVDAGAGITHDDIREAVFDYLATLSPNETHYNTGAEDAIKQIDPARVRLATQTTPSAAETDPTEPQMAIRTAADGSDIAVTLYEVAADGTETLNAE